MNKPRFCNLWLGVVALSLTTSGCQPSQTLASDAFRLSNSDRAVMIKNINVIDGTGRDSYLANVTVKGDRIHKIDRDLLERQSSNLVVIDGTGKYLMPGFVDLLTHISFRSRLNATDPYELTPLFSDIQLPAHERLRIHKSLLKSALKGGVTTFVDSISAISDVKQLKQSINSSAYPNFYSLGPIVGTTDGHPYPVHNTPWHYAIDLSMPIEAIRAKVNADFEKWFVEDGLLGIKVSIDSPPEGGQPAATPLPDDVVKVVFEAAKSRGKPIFFISFTEEGINRGARYGGNVKLGPPVVLTSRGLGIASDATFTNLKEANVGVISLLSNWGGGLRAYLNDFELQYPNPSALVYDSYFRNADEPTKSQYETLFERFFRKDPWFMNAVYNPVGNNMFTLAKGALDTAHGFDIPLFASGDTGSFWVFHGHYYLELQHLVGTLSPLELITAATLGPAKAIGIDNQVGSIEEGKLADMLILGENPLDDVSNLKNIEAVMKSGAVVDFH
jgi:hypothetical protein